MASFNDKAMKYKASLGITSALITAMITLCFGCLIAFLIYRMRVTTETFELILAVVAIMFILGIYLLSYLYSPRQYIVDRDHIIIRRTIKDVKIPVNEIEDAFLIKRESMGWTERVGSSGGVFGYYGKFKNAFGLMTWYATKRTNYIMIETVHKDKIILTPDDTEMVKEIRRLIGK